MSRNNTGNPIDSKAFPDFEDNVKNFDEAVNTADPQWVDRFGRFRLPLMEQERQFVSDQERREGEFQDDQSSREAVFSDFLQGSGYQDLGEYAPGIEITAHNQYVTFGGQPYLLKPSIPVPYTTSGEWTGDDFKLIGDDALRQDLANPDMGAAMVARGVVAVDSIADLLALPEGQRKEGLRYMVAGYHGGWAAEAEYRGPTGGGNFDFDANAAKSMHNGSTIIDPDRAYPTQWDSDEPGLEAWFYGEPNPGFGVFVKEVSDHRYVAEAGAKGDLLSDDYLPIQAIIDSFGNDARSPRNVRIGRGRFRITQGITPCSPGVGGSFSGEVGWNLGELKTFSEIVSDIPDGEYAIKSGGVDAPSGFRMGKFMLTGLNPNAHGLDAERLRYSEFESVFFRGAFSTALKLNNSWGSVLSNIKIWGPGIGIAIDFGSEANSVTFDRPQIYECGVAFTGTKGRKVVINNPLIEDCGVAFDLEQFGGPITVVDPYLESVNVLVRLRGRLQGKVELIRPYIRNAPNAAFGTQNSIIKVEGAQDGIAGIDVIDPSIFGDEYDSPVIDLDDATLGGRLHIKWIGESSRAQGAGVTPGDFYSYFGAVKPRWRDCYTDKLLLDLTPYIASGGSKTDLLFGIVYTRPRVYDNGPRDMSFVGIVGSVSYPSLSGTAAVLTGIPATLSPVRSEWSPPLVPSGKTTLPAAGAYARISIRVDGSARLVPVGSELTDFNGEILNFSGLEYALG